MKHLRWFAALVLALAAIMVAVNDFGWVGFAGGVVLLVGAVSVFRQKAPWVW